jgi:hypothetical protein
MRDAMRWFITTSEGFPIHFGFAVHVDRGDGSIRHVATFATKADADEYVAMLATAVPR